MMKNVFNAAAVALFLFAQNHVFGQIPTNLNATTSLQTKGATHNEAASNAAAMKKIRVPKGTIVSLELNGEVTSDDVQVGDVVKLSVSMPVFVDGNEVILRGSYGEAVVQEVKKARGFGRAGKIVVAADNVTTFDGNRIKLIGQPISAVGKNRKILAWTLTISGGALAGGLLLTPAGPTIAAACSPFLTMGAMVKGKAAVLVGKTLRAVTAEDVFINANPTTSNLFESE